MHAFILLVLAVAAAGIDVSIHPWLSVIGGSVVIVAIVSVVAAVRLSGYAYVWFTIATTMLVDIFLGTPLGARSALFLAALVLVQPFIRTFRQQRGFLPLAIIGIVLTTVEHLRVMVGHPAGGWMEWWAPSLYAWASSAAWVTAVSYFASRLLRPRVPLHATTPI